MQRLSAAAVEAEHDSHQLILTLKRLFLETSTFAEHMAALRSHDSFYLACLVQLLRLAVAVKDANKARCLAALWTLKKYEAVEILLETSFFGVADVLRAVSLLDTPRRIRALNKRLNRLQRNGHVRAVTLARMNATLNELKREPVEEGSLSGALCRRVRAWIAKFPERQLTYFALQMPKEPWIQLADLIHVVGDLWKNFLSFQNHFLIFFWFSCFLLPL